MFQLKSWLKRGNTPQISTSNWNAEGSSPSLHQKNTDMECDEEERCHSATDSAFGVEEIVRIDFISELPYEISVAILAKVSDLKTFSVIPTVSRRWNYICTDNDIWKSLFYLRWKPIGLNTSSSTFHSVSSSLASPIILHQQSTSGPLTIQTVPQPTSPTTTTLYSHPISSNPPTTALCHQPKNDWKYNYIQRLKLNKNWTTGAYSVRTLKDGHDDAVYCIQFDGDRLITGSRDRSIKLWHLPTFVHQKTFKGHTGSVLCLQYDDQIIVTGSSDHTIMVWEIASGTRLHVLRGHGSPVLDVRFNSSVIVSCSKDCLVKVWDLKTGILLRTLSGHQAAVNAIHLHGDHVVSASGDSIVKLWNVYTGQHVRDFVGHGRGLACVQYDGVHVVSGSNDQTIKVWNAETGECLKTLVGHTDLVRTLCFDGVRIVSGSYDCTIKVWDLATGKLLHDLKDPNAGNGGGDGEERAVVHGSWIFHVQMDATKIVSASQDRVIAVWDFSNGCDLI